MPKLLLQFVQLPFERVVGIYEARGERRRMPDRLRQLAPDAARSYVADLADVVVVSDMLRTAESSLQAVREGRGAQPPSKSAHNFGFAIDLDISASLARLGQANLGFPVAPSKADLDAFMLAAGWYCHRRDHKRDHESWHFNF